MKPVSSLLILVVVAGLPLSGQNLLNGDLEGEILGFSTLPPSWIRVDHTDPNCIATLGGTSPDLISSTEPGSVQGAVGVPYSGETFMGGSLGISPTTGTMFQEGIQQYVSGFIVGESYLISFYQAVVKVNTCIDTSGSWMVVVDDSVIGISPPVSSYAAFDDTLFKWEERRVQFTATDTAHFLKFLPVDDDNNQQDLYDEGGCLYMGLDLITITQCSSPPSQQSVVACTHFSWIDGETYTSDTVVSYVATNLAGCDSIVSLDLTIVAFTDSVTQSGTTLEAVEGGAGYQWLTCPEYLPINGATGQSFAATENGSYAVAITQDGCVDTSACYVVSSVSIDEPSFADQIAVFPNPSEGDYLIELGESISQGTLTVSNLRGQLIYSMSIQGQEQLSLRLEAPPGVYLLEITTPEKRAGVRLMIR